MNPRLRRLQRDHQDLIEFTARSPAASILQVEGNPPEKYILQLNCRGITEVDGNGHPQFGDVHQLGIWLHDNYPTKKPLFKMLTKIFHPNIAASGDVCIGYEGGDGWAPAMTLSDVLLRTLHIIRYENIGFESPYNSHAETWARDYKRRHPNAFPIDTSDLMLPELDILILDDDDNDDDLDIKIL